MFNQMFRIGLGSYWIFVSLVFIETHEASEVLQQGRNMAHVSPYQIPCRSSYINQMLFEPIAQPKTAKYLFKMDIDIWL